MPIDVLCIGHAAFDNVLYVEGFPAENQKYEVQEMLVGAGGPAANAALLLSRWGVACAFAGVVGNDFYGLQILAELTRAGVHTKAVDARAGHGTPVSTILVNKHNGSRTIINRKAKAEPLTLSAGVLTQLSPKVILVDGHELAAAKMAIRAFPEAMSILDAGSVREGTLALAPEVDALVASERFAKQAAGMDTLESESERRTCLETLRRKFEAPLTAITLGERGVIADWGAGVEEIPAPEVKVVDTTGAGDIFHGACAYGMLQKWTWHEILLFATRTAALSVTRRGGSQSIPTLEEVESMRG